MTSNRATLAGLTRFVFDVPRWPASVAVVLCTAAASGTVVFSLSGSAVRAAAGLPAFALPALTASVATVSVARLVDAPMTFDRASLLAAICEVGIAALLVATTVVVRAFALSPGIALASALVVFALAFAFRLFVERLLFDDAAVAAVGSAAIQPLGTGLLLFGLAIPGPWTAPTLPGRAGVVTLLVFLTGAYGALAAVLFRALDRPLRREFEVGLPAFVSAFVAYLSGRPAPLESFFADLGERVVVPVTVLSFRVPGGEERARFVLPSVHPGPMADVGGGRLPRRLAETTGNLVFPFHAMTGHDFDVVTERGVERIADAVEEAVDQVKYAAGGTPGIESDTAGVDVTGQAIGEDAFFTTTFAPEPTDDVAYSVGRVVDAEARRAGFDDVLVADAHNCVDGSVGDSGVRTGTARAKALREAVRHTADCLHSIDDGPVEFGVAWDSTPWDRADGIGPLGVRVALTQVGESTTAYVLVDGNNMVPGLRDRIVEALPEIDTTEVLTTDTHAVNATTTGKRVGDAIDERELVDRIRRLAREAREDLEPVEAGMETVWTEVPAFGSARTTRLAAIGTFLISVGRVLVVVMLVAALASTTLVFSIIGIL